MMLQRTIKKSVKVTGVGLHTGEKVTLTLYPALPNTGIIYSRLVDGKRVDFEKDNFYVEGTALCTKLVHKETGYTLATVEHLNAALSAYKIDNLIIEVDNLEIPIMNGSSSPFLWLLDEAGIEFQDAPKKFLMVSKEVEYRIDDKLAKLSPFDAFFIDFTIAFNHPAISATNCHWTGYINEETFKNDLSRARTFGFLKEIEYLQNQGLCLGGSLDNAIVLNEFGVMNKGELHYPDEFVRHKVLDAVGDLFIAQRNIVGKLTAYKSGHELNNKVLNKAFEENAFKLYEFKNKDEVREELSSWNFDLAF